MPLRLERAQGAKEKNLHQEEVLTVETRRQ